MKRISRAGRQNEIYMLLMREAKKDSRAVFFVGDVARKMRLKSSTYLKNLCRNLVKLKIGVFVIETERGDYFGYKPPVQTDFFDRVIIINNKPITVREIPF